MPLDRITLFCFGASYAVALVLEFLHLLQPRMVHRLLGIAFGAAGLLAHTIFLGVQRPPLASHFGSTLFLAWILAIYYLYGSIHHRRQAWAVFVLPLILALVGLAAVVGRPTEAEPSLLPGWGILHVVLLLLAAVGVCVGFLASVMYLFQAHRLKAKVLPGQGLNLLSLERLEEMNRRAITLAFPLLTAGMLIGVALMAQKASQLSWSDPQVIGTFMLWLVFAILLYLRYGLHLRGRNVALLTIVAFVLLLFTLVISHSAVPGGGP